MMVGITWSLACWGRPRNALEVLVVSDHVAVGAEIEAPNLGQESRTKVFEVSRQVSETLEENEHTTFEVYAAPLQESDDYFRTLRKELQEALGEGVILIERQEIVLI